MDRGSIILELSRNYALPRSQEGNFSILTEEAARTIIMAQRMEAGMEEAMDKAAPTRQHHPRQTCVISLVISVVRLGIMQMIAQKLKMEMAMEAQERSRTLSTGGK